MTRTTEVYEIPLGDKGWRKTEEIICREGKQVLREYITTSGDVDPIKLVKPMARKHIFPTGPVITGAEKEIRSYRLGRDSSLGDTEIISQVILFYARPVFESPFIDVNARVHAKYVSELLVYANHMFEEIPLIDLLGEISDCCRIGDPAVLLEHIEFDTFVPKQMTPAWQLMVAFSDVFEEDD